MSAPERWFDGIVHLGPQALKSKGGHIAYVSILYLGTTFPDIAGTTREWKEKLEEELNLLRPGDLGLIPMPEMVAFADTFEEFTLTAGLVLYIYIGGPPWPREAAIARGVFDGPKWENKPEMICILKYLRELTQCAIDETLGR